MGKLVHFRPNDFSPPEVNGLPFNYTMKYQHVTWGDSVSYILHNISLSFHGENTCFICMDSKLKIKLNMNLVSKTVYVIGYNAIIK